ncbi:MAG: TetR/AcrR family transcriptional regulator [Microlunatus sp.]|nr:TetR/AcrR family transcriptional regulator [Microlunatus sp.]MDN5803409.1 TetR/AcrR family transcriptional regulator [Microlunatus sp.]
MTAARTKAHLQRVGLDMIAEAGYEAVTVEQIARAAGVSHMTFFRHFPTKQSLVLEDPFDPAIAAAIAAQPPGASALARACRGVRVALDAVSLPEEDQVRIRVRIGASTPSLTAGIWANTLATQVAIADALSTLSPPYESRIAAAATIGALTVAVLEWGTGPADRRLKDNLLEALNVLDPLDPLDPLHQSEHSR